MLAGHVPATDISILATQDQSFILYGTGQAADAGFEFTSGIATSPNGKASFESILTNSMIVRSANGADVLLIDGERTEMTRYLSYRNGALVRALGVLSDGAKTFYGDLPDDTVTDSTQLRDVRELSSKVSSAAVKRYFALTSWRRTFAGLTSVIPSAHAQSVGDIVDAVFAGDFEAAKNAMMTRNFKNAAVVLALVALGVVAVVYEMPFIGAGLIISGLLTYTKQAMAADVPRQVSSALQGLSITVGDYAFAAAGSVRMLQEPCGEDGGPVDFTRTLSSADGHGTVRFSDGRYQMTCTFHKDFGAFNFCGPFQQFDDFILSVRAAGSHIIGTTRNSADDVIVTLDRSSGNGTYVYNHHFFGDGKNHVGQMQGVASPTTWKTQQQIQAEIIAFLKRTL